MQVSYVSKYKFCKINNLLINYYIFLVPVTRPQDLAKPGTGRIQLLNRRTDPTRITGIGTEFTRQLKIGSHIALMDCSSEVTEIFSDTELIIKKEFKDPNA